LDANLRWGKGILITRLLLFLGLLVGMILLAGLLFSRGDKAISEANAQERYSSSDRQENSIKADSDITNPGEALNTIGQGSNSSR
jgi:hypothetical protein